ncbi:hypothetical protein [Subdoligranulum variabile]|uniref:hypothetical protein n=1 Tax=Subdoligranulum variabile TaxID=214851 RepID=UPI0026ED01A8|nr:hypothetical protein [Subdoligranulum variabile]
MAADGSIIIDTRVNTKGAEADLKALQAKAKSTAQQISALDKQITQATGKRTKLADDLAKAKAEAQATETALQGVNSQLAAAKTAAAAQVRQEYPGMSDANVNDIATSRALASHASLVAESDKLIAALDKQTATVAEIEGEYQKQAVAVEQLEQKHSNLQQQLEQEQAAAQQASIAYEKAVASQQRAKQFQSADYSMQEYFSKQEAAISQSFAKAQGRQNKLLGIEPDPVKHAEAVVQATQKEIAAQDQAAKAAEERAAREEAAAKRRAAVNVTGVSRTTEKAYEPAKRIEAASTAMQKFGTRLGGIVSGALLFNVISSALTKMVGWFGSAMQSSDAFRQSLANLQGAASVAAAPLVQTLGNALSYVINLLATGISYLARFISLLTGKSIGAMKSAAKGMNSYGSAASGAAKDTEKATRSLAGFDEITRLDAPQDNTSGGGGGSGDLTPNYDFVDQTGAGFASLMDRVQDFWSAFKEALAPSIAAWSAAWEQIKATALAVWPQMQAAASGLWTNALQPLLSYLAGTFVPGVVNSFSQAFAPIVGGAISTAIQAFADFFVWACGIMTDAINNILRPALEVLLQIWQDMMAGIQNAWNTYGQPIMDGVVAAFRNLESIFSTLYYTVVEPILSNLVDLLQKLWNEHLKQLWDDLLLLFGSVQNTILTFWNSVLSPLINWLIASFGPVFSDVFNAVAGIVETAVGLMADAIDIILVVLRGLLDFLSAVFRGDWGAAWNAIADTALAVWDRIKSGIKSAVNGIIGFINGMIQAVVNGLNRVIDAINTLSFDVPDWVPGIGGSSLGFSISHITAPQIPYLAQGAVIPPNREFMAVLGDQSHGTNVEAPLATIQEAVAAVMQDYQDGNLAALQQVLATLREILSAIYGINIGDEVIGQAAARYQTRQAIITGRV